MSATIAPRITPFLWFDDQAEQAVDLYVSVFDNSRILDVTRYGEENARLAGHAPGSLMTVSFELDGQRFSAINGGPHFTLTEAFSLVVTCRDQAEVDYFWDRLGAGGDPRAQQCGWLKDRFGLSWQIVPSRLFEPIADPHPARAQRATQAMVRMKTLDIAALARAADG